MMPSLDDEQLDRLAELELMAQVDPDCAFAECREWICAWDPNAPETAFVTRRMAIALGLPTGP